MDASERQEWLKLVSRSLRSLDELSDDQIQRCVEIALNIKNQLSSSTMKPNAVALMLMQLEDLEPTGTDYDPAFA